METADRTKIDDFLRELTELSLKHKLGISGPFDLFVMEYDDLDRTYCDDKRGKYEFY